MRLVGWGSVTGEASYMLANIFGTYDRERRRGAANSSRHSNPQLDALTERAVATLDDAQRETLLQAFRTRCPVYTTLSRAVAVEIALE